MSSLFADHETIAGLYRKEPLRVSQSVQPLFWERMLKSQDRCQRDESLPMTTMSRRWGDQDVRAGLEMEMPPMFSQFFSQVESENWGVLVDVDYVKMLEVMAYGLVEDLALRCAHAKDVKTCPSREKWSSHGHTCDRCRYLSKVADNKISPMTRTTQNNAYLLCAYPTILNPKRFSKASQLKSS
jgi:hypothetical protein